jgi:hypothetical protein
MKKWKSHGHKSVKLCGPIYKTYKITMSIKHNVNNVFNVLYTQWSTSERLSPGLQIPRSRLIAPLALL